MQSHHFAETRNRDGRLVRMDWGTWQHVLNDHPELDGLLHDVMRTVATPDYRAPDARAGRERYFRRSGPHGWFRVVTELAGSTDRVVTAFLQENDPRPRSEDR